ncbi:MAG TPA: osmotically inducible protein OsmC [Acidobacteria bacterium]|nr:osmotically inducible protein OsmC [Acidobacteriota bacterium]
MAVDAEYKGMTIHTDQPTAHGGGGTAPAPFDLFLASIGTCAGFYALRFCQERGLSTEGMGLSMATELDTATKRIGTIRLDLQLPEGFPEKYKTAILRSMDQCTVKRHIVDAPRFEIAVAVSELAGA